MAASTSTRSGGRTRASRPDAPDLIHIYETLDRRYGGETWHWSPDYVQSPADVVFGAILVQHTTWTNADRALEALRGATGLDPAAILALDDSGLRSLVRVGGTPAVKARRLRALARTIIEAGGMDAFLALPAGDLRAQLLATHGVGPETADAIALYAAGQRVFVIDAYTRRLFARIGLTPRHDTYEAWRGFFEDALPADATLYQRYHAWIVLHCKAICRATPRCDGCPVASMCATGRARANGAGPRG